MGPTFIEKLEDRKLLSAAAIFAVPPAREPLVPLRAHAAAKSTSPLYLVGTYTGTVRTDGVYPFTLMIKSQKKNGVFTGTGTTPSNTVSFRAQGRVGTDRVVTMNGKGSSLTQGSFTFTGTGKISADGKALNMKLTLVQGSKRGHASFAVRQQ